MHSIQYEELVTVPDADFDNAVDKLYDKHVRELNLLSKQEFHMLNCIRIIAPAIYLYFYGKIIFENYLDFDDLHQKTILKFLNNQYEKEDEAAIIADRINNFIGLIKPMPEIEEVGKSMASSFLFLYAKHMYLRGEEHKGMYIVDIFEADFKLYCWIFSLINKHIKIIP